jgi:hypothetical protein
MSQVILTGNIVLGIESSISTLTSTDIVLQSSISTLNSTDIVLQSSISTLSSIVSGLQFSVSTLSSRDIVLQSSISTLSSTDIVLQSSISTVSSSVLGLQSSVSTLGSIVSDIQNSSSGGITLDDASLPIVDISSKAMPNFAKEWTTCTNAGTPNIIDIACSGDGKISLVCPWSVGTSQITRDYGESWSTPTGLSSNIWSCSMNLDGKYIVVSDFFNFKISSDYGSTFTLPNNRPFQLQRSALSATGKYIVCGCTQNQGLQVSSDYGSNWSVKETGIYTWNDVAISLDGSVMYGCSDSGIIKKSTNYGATWSTIYTDVSSRSIRSISCSDDGQYILAAFQTSSQLLLSINSGSSFNSVGSTASYYKVAMSKNGIYMMASVNGSTLYYSINNGSTWSSVSSSNQFCAICMSYNGETNYNVSPYNKPILNLNSRNLISGTQPLIPAVGSNYIDTATNKLYVYNGTAWKSVTLT